MIDDDNSALEGAADDTSQLSISEAASAYAGTMTEEEPDEGQTETEIDPTGDDEAEDDALSADEADGDEDEGDTEDEGQAEDDSAEPESDQGRYVAGNGKVRLPDGSTATVADLIAGNLRDRDYRQKTMALSEEKKTFETQSQTVKQRETQVNEQADYMVNLLKSIVPPPPDIALLQTDPAGYITQEAHHKQWMQHLQYLDEQKQLGIQQSQAEAQTKETERRASEFNSLLEAVPAFKDGKRLDAFADDVMKFGATVYKFSPDELRAVAMDHRQAIVLRDAIAWRKLQANKTKAVAKVDGRPPVLKGGTRLDPTRAKARDTRVAMDRLEQSGSVKDGIAALLALEGKG